MNEKAQNEIKCEQISGSMTPMSPYDTRKDLNPTPNNLKLSYSPKIQFISQFTIPKMLSPSHNQTQEGSSEEGHRPSLQERRRSSLPDLVVTDHDEETAEGGQGISPDQKQQFSSTPGDIDFFAWNKSSNPPQPREGMPTIYERVVAVISKPSEFRAEFECQELVPWFRNKSHLFTSLKPEIVADVIRHCTFEKRPVDDVIIKQGEDGDRLYIVLKGQLSIYVIQEKDESAGILKQVQTACEKPVLERHLLGQKVWTTGEGKTVGEVALLKDDCIRTASVVIDKEADFVVIDRALYNRSVRDVLENEYKQKTTFVDKNTLFQTWPQKQKRQLVISLKKEILKWGCPLAKQGAEAEQVYFILSGEVEITIDQNLYKTQYADLWSEMEALVPGLLPPVGDVTRNPHHTLHQKPRHHKMLQMCLLGSNEIIGILEVLLGLNNFMENAIVTREVEALSLSKENFERLFSKKFAIATDQKLREILTMRMYLYIHRSDLFISGSPFLKFLTFLLRDPDTLKQLRRQNRRANGGSVGSPSSRRHVAEDVEVGSMLKVLKVSQDSRNIPLPQMEISQRVLHEIETGLKDWISRNRSDTGTVKKAVVRARPKKKTFLDEDFLKPTAPLTLEELMMQRPKSTH